MPTRGSEPGEHIGIDPVSDASPSDDRRRRLVEGAPGLRQSALETFTRLYDAMPDQTSEVDAVLHQLDPLIDLVARRRIAIVGCGPRPEPLRILRDRGFEVLGVEPVADFRDAARRHLGEETAVLEGSAEEVPIPDESQDVLWLESVLEHVESVGKTLDEAYRVLAPGGVAYICTTNRLQLKQGEFNVRFFQWLPNLLKESYVFQHLHHDPHLANETERPAVHWFTYSELCRLGREAGFYKFYSLVDVKSPEPENYTGSDATKRLKAKALGLAQTRPWLRALILTQRGGIIFMVKRG